MNKNRWLPIKAISLILASGSTFILSGCGEKNAGPGQMPPQQVEVIVAKATSAEITTVLPARTTAYRIAEIRPQVSGTILKRQFIEGSDVAEGQSLYLIEPGIYQANYNSAKASLSSAKANAEVSRLTFNRYKALLGSKSISRQEYDNAAATYTQARAQVDVAQAALDNAEINLAYTKVHSPIKGRISKSNVTEGALVTNGQANFLATVQQLDPIYVDMTQSTTDYLRLQQDFANGTIKRQDGQALIKLTLENGQPYEHEGTLQFSDVTVNETTGSISLRAVFPNPNNTLLPGMFVRTTLNEGSQQGVFLIPQKAVTRDAKGNTSVKIVDPRNVIDAQQVKVSAADTPDLAIVEGLPEGTQILSLDLQKITTPGMFIQVKPYVKNTQGGVVIPKNAIRTDAQGNSVVITVSKVDTIETRKVTVAEARDSNWIVTGGLKEGDRVVTSGLQKIADGKEVQIKNNVAPAQLVDGNQPNSPAQK